MRGGQLAEVIGERKVHAVAGHFLPPGRSGSSSVLRSHHGGTISYATDVGALNVALDMQLSEIRAKQDRGEISARQAADVRVRAMSRHPAAVEALRARYFPEQAGE
jgi:hypothetical protein